MAKKFPEHKQFDPAKINDEILQLWDQEKTFEKSLEIRKESKAFVFYEGPPSANGIPGIHHVISRAIKDIFCRYKTMQGYFVERKAGWDTHGLPIELSVEKTLGITKEDIGKRITVDAFNQACRKDVMKYTREWEELTRIMGYWINMDHPYITYDNRYIESLWYLLKKLFDKGLLYKGYSIQPYSPAAGTGLSTHELNQPGCYRDIKDTTIVAQFRVIKDEKSGPFFKDINTGLFILAWTTTPWTLPSNTALAVGPGIVYQKIRTFNGYTGAPITVIIAKDLASRYFPEKDLGLALDDYQEGDKRIPYSVLEEFPGSRLKGLRYEQLLPWVDPGRNAFRVITGDFVTTDEGTGVVHIAPTFGADDYRAGIENNIPPLMVSDRDGILSPLVDRKGRFIRLEDIHPDFLKKRVNLDAYRDFAGRYVKNEYDESLTEKDPPVDVDIAVHLKKEGLAFRIEKHIHNYPHCWRTDKPVLYYPIDAWFVKTTALKDRMIELNNTINWKPAATGTGRFGKWLENLVDWNLSRSRYWGTPLPIWTSENKKEQKCIGSVAELKAEIDKALKAGFMKTNPVAAYTEGDNSTQNYSTFDLHRPFVDEIILVSPSGRRMFREPDLIDVWFDSGAMPYAQFHYPFGISEEEFRKVFPAEFIAEGVDQTRGWFFTLHALAVMLFDSVSFRNIVSNGLVLDKNGNKMSKRLGNAVDPFDAIKKHGSDPLRWYLISNAQPWDNLKFDMAGLDEVKRKFFGTLFNTYSFFALYANIDGFRYDQDDRPVKDRPEIDRWIISLLHSLVEDVRGNYEQYEPTRAARAIQDFVTENLSNWYVRLNRKRFWGGEWNEDKIAAYQTLHTCLETVALLSAPIAPFYSDMVFRDLNRVSERFPHQSVHLADFPGADTRLIDRELEHRMELAQKVSSMVLGLRRKVNIKVRQPLNRIMIPVSDESVTRQFEAVKHLIMNEVNVKEIEYIRDSAGILVKKIKPDFKRLGPRYGKMMKLISNALGQMTQEDIMHFEREEQFSMDLNGEKVTILRDDVEIISEDIPGWLVTNDGTLTVALDIIITPQLRDEGIARELVNRIQNIRKESGFNVTDKIRILIEQHASIYSSINTHRKYIATQTLASQVKIVEHLDEQGSREIEIDKGVIVNILVEKVV